MEVGWPTCTKLSRIHARFKSLLIFGYFTFLALNQNIYSKLWSASLSMRFGGGTILLEVSSKGKCHFCTKEKTKMRERKKERQKVISYPR